MSAITKYEGPSARRISGTALAVRTLSGQTKLLVPVSAAAATAKKPHHKQILVVPTPGGGARLATVANSSSNSSILRHTHLHPHHNYSSSSSSTTGPGGSIRRDSSSYTYRVAGVTNNDGYKSNSPSSSRYNGNHDNSNNGAIDPAQLFRQQQLQLKQLREHYLKAKREEEMIPEWKRKEDFFAALGLVTKQALKEIQNKKCERKRRTTANPQFSNAAIEAKRINAMEVAAKRAKRREMAAAERIPSTSAPLTRIARRNSQMPIVPIQSSSLRSSLRPTQASSQSTTGPPSSSTSTSFHHKAVFRQFPNSPSTNMTVVPDRSRNLVEKLRSRYQLHSSPYQIHRSNSSSSHNTVNISNNIRSVNLSISKPTKILHDCYTCCEPCDADLDAIMICIECRCYFHATCVASVDEINKNNSVPCPSCDKETSTTFDGFKPVPAFEDLGSHADAKSNCKIDLGKVGVQEEVEEDMEDLDEDEEDRNLMEIDDNVSNPSNSHAKPVVHNIKEILHTIGDVKQINIVPRGGLINNQARSHTQVSIKTKEAMLNQKNEILKIIAEDKKRFVQLTSKLENLKEEKIILLQDRDKIQTCLDKVTNVIKLIKGTSDEPEEKERSQPEKIEESSEETNNNPKASNEITSTSCEERKTIESESSSSDDDSSDSEDSEDDEDDGQSIGEKCNKDLKKPSTEVDQLKGETIGEVAMIEGPSEVVEQQIALTNESTISIVEGELQTILTTDESLIPQSIDDLNEIVSDDAKDGVDVGNFIAVDKSIKIEEGPSEVVSQDVTQYGVTDDGTVIEEIVNLGGDELLITTTGEEEVIVGSESITLEKCNQFDDETSAAVASIQDQLDADGL